MHLILADDVGTPLVEIVELPIQATNLLLLWLIIFCGFMAGLIVTMFVLKKKLLKDKDKSQVKLP